MSLQEFLDLIGELADNEEFDEEDELYPMEINVGELTIPVMLPLFNAWAAQLEYGPIFRFIIEEE